MFAAGGALLAPARMSVYAEEAQQAEVPISAHSDEGIMPLACTYVEMPTIQVGGMNAHYCFTTYTVTQEDTHATLLEGRIGVSDRYPCYTEHLNYKQTRNIVAHSSSSDYTCYQNNVKFIRAKCEADGVYSTYNNYLATPGHVASAYFMLTDLQQRVVLLILTMNQGLFGTITQKTVSYIVPLHIREKL